MELKLSVVYLDLDRCASRGDCHLEFVNSIDHILSLTFEIS